jgi:hypothetical protein
MPRTDMADKSAFQAARDKFIALEQRQDDLAKREHDTWVAWREAKGDADEAFQAMLDHMKEMARLYPEWGVRAKAIWQDGIADL